MKSQYYAWTQTLFPVPHSNPNTIMQCKILYMSTQNICGTFDSLCIKQFNLPIGLESKLMKFWSKLMKFWSGIEVDEVLVWK